MIQHNKPCFDTQDEQAVIAALQSGYVAEGKEVEGLEIELASYVGCRRGVLVNSGTTALYLALRSINIGKEDEVVLPTYVCSALLNAIFMIGAKPCLVDVNEDDFNINWDKVAAIISPNTKAIIVPHIHGMPSALPGETFHDIPIIEDCATALGSYIRSSEGFRIHVGNTAKVSILSFYASKFCAMGYGGFVISNQDNITDSIFNYREFDCVEEYEPRFNFQVSDLNAALGRSQLRKVDTFLRKRKEIRDKYDVVFDAKGIKRQESSIDCEYNNYRYIIRLNAKEVEKFSSYLLDKGIKAIIPIETYELLHNYLKLSKNDFEIAENIAKTTLSIPIYPALTDREVDYIVETIKQY